MQRSYLGQADRAQKAALSQGNKIADLSKKIAAIAHDQSRYGKDLDRALKPKVRPNSALPTRLGRTGSPPNGSSAKTGGPRRDAAGKSDKPKNRAGTKSGSVLRRPDARTKQPPLRW